MLTLFDKREPRKGALKIPEELLGFVNIQEEVYGAPHNDLDWPDYDDPQEPPPYLPNDDIPSQEDFDWFQTHILEPSDIEKMRKDFENDFVLLPTLPENPSYQYLCSARDKVIDFLYTGSTLLGVPQEEITERLKDAFQKLLEIVLLIQDAPPGLPDDDIPF